MIRATVDPAIGERIRQRREALGMECKALAYHAKISRAHTCHIEKGQNVPSIAVLLRVANALGCKASFLLGEKP